LSQNKGVASVCISPKSPRTNLNQIACVVASDSETYSASAVDSATVFCFTKAQENAPLPKLNAYSEVLLLSSSLPAQSASQNPIRVAD
jgi:hypothetical protein